MKNKNNLSCIEAKFHLMDYLLFVKHHLSYLFVYSIFLVLNCKYIIVVNLNNLIKKRGKSVRMCYVYCTKYMQTPEGPYSIVIFTVRVLTLFIPGFLELVN